MALPLLAAAVPIVGAVGVGFAAATAPGFALFFIEEALQTTSFSFMHLVNSKQWKGVETNLKIYDGIIETYRKAINIIGAVYKLDPTDLLFSVIVRPHIEFYKASRAFSAAMHSVVRLHLGREDETYKVDLGVIQDFFNAEHARVTQNKAISLQQIKLNQQKNRDKIFDEYNSAVKEFTDDRNDSLNENQEKIDVALAPHMNENKIFKSDLRFRYISKEVSREDYLAQATEADRVLAGQIAAVKSEFNNERLAINETYGFAIRSPRETRTKKLRALQQSYNDTWVAIQVDEKRQRRILFQEYNNAKLDLDERHFPTEETAVSEEGVVDRAIPAEQITPLVPGPEVPQTPSIPPFTPATQEDLDRAAQFSAETGERINDFSSSGHSDARNSPTSAGVNAVLSASKLNSAIRSAARAVINAAPSAARAVFAAAAFASTKVISVATSIKNAASRTLNKIFRSSKRKK